MNGDKALQAAAAVHSERSSGTGTANPCTVGIVIIPDFGLPAILTRR